jgi:hypothetical protein
MNDALTFLKVVIVFIGVVWSIRRKAPIGLALSAGGVVIAIFMGRTADWVGAQLAGGLDAVLFSTSTGRFVGVMGMIVGITSILQASGEMKRLTVAFRAALRRPRVVMATLPAIIGFLPMPGGALFSAPMVEASAGGTALSAEDKALVNYWYRHVWECVCPIYASVILCAKLVHREVKVLSLALLPIALVAIVAGLGFLGKTAPHAEEANGSRRRAALNAVAGLLPLIVLFILYAATPVGLVVATAIGLLFAAAWHVAARNLGPGTLLRTLFVNPGILDMMLMGFGAVIFGEMMEKSGAIAGISSLFLSLGLPLALLAIALPVVVAFFSGMTIVYVSTTFPLLLAYPGVMENPLPVIALAFAAGFCGMLLSPLHSCLVVSTRYFRADLLGPIRRMIVPCGVILAAGVGLMLVLKQIKV